MKSRDFWEALSEIDDRYITEAACYRKNCANPVKRRSAVIAAGICFGIFLIGGTQFLISHQTPEDASGSGYYTGTAVQKTFEATVLEVGKNTLLVKPAAEAGDERYADTILIDTENLADQSTKKYVSKAEPGDIVKIGYFEENSDPENGELSVYEIIPAK